MTPSTSSDRPANRLAQETSPYLLQHAHNPVDWYPWGEDAFAAAREAGKPIFLSVGYSACHWCHVMERESFENEEIAKLLNERFISVKVDREERPDVDQIYMSAVQLVTRRGGWPMSVFLTPDGKPFYGGTYWPPVSRQGMPGFRDILLKLSDYWKNKRDEVDASAEKLVDAIQSMAAPAFERRSLGIETLQKAMQSLLSAADRQQGGFGAAPKFPHAVDIRLLLRCAKRFANDEARQTACFTLDRMARGGIYDQLKGGFHRYATDAGWLVPHFEKMLYDNALLVPAYLEAWQLTKNEQFARVARETLDYVLDEMTSPQGGFFSTQDADSEGEEGRFFVWTDDEIRTALTPEEVRAVAVYFDVTPSGNWEGKTILNRPLPDDEAARKLGMSDDALRKLIKNAQGKLLSIREQRVRPGRDDKILVGWNGLMIAALAQASLVLDEPRYREAAEVAARFLLDRLRDEEGRLLHSFKDNQARFAAYLDDYACLIDGLTELYQASADESYLKEAMHLAEQVQSHFADVTHGGFFYTADDHEELIARTKDAQDNATPSGNGMMATALLKLTQITGQQDYQELAMATLDSMGELLDEHPLAAAQALLALDFFVGPHYEVVLIDAADGQADELSQHIWQQFLPNKVFIRHHASAAPSVVSSLVEGRCDGPTRLFICEQGTCQTPAQDLETAAAALAAL